MADRCACQAGSGPSRLAERPETEELSKAGLLHFSPADSGEVTGDQPQHEAVVLKAPEHLLRAGTGPAAQRGTSPDVKPLGGFDDFRKSAADRPRGDIRPAHYLAQNVLVQHPGDRHAVHAHVNAHDLTDRFHQRIAVVRPGTADEGSVDIEQHQCVPLAHADYYSGMDAVFPGGKRLRLLRGDITGIRVDAIVNAANAQLAGGGGVDGAIHRAGGPTIMRELDEIRSAQGGCPTGSAVVTGAGALPARFVFHAVGPVYRDGKHGEPEQLRSCYRTSLSLAEDLGLSTVSFPAISTGVYGYPLREAAQVALSAIGEHLASEESGVREVLMVLASPEPLEVHSHILSGLYPDQIE